MNGPNERVAHIIDAIDEFAFQASMFALHAAVEPERVGDGTGLTHAAKDVAALIAESIERACQGGRKLAMVAKLEAISAGFAALGISFAPAGGPPVKASNPSIERLPL